MQLAKGVSKRPNIVREVKTKSREKGVGFSINKEVHPSNEGRKLTRKKSMQFCTNFLL